MKVYLSGQVSGLTPVEYRANFSAAAAQVAKMFAGESDLTIIDPTTLPEIHSQWADYILRDLIILRDCDVIAMLPDWERSIGARIENLFAVKCGIKVLYCNNTRLWRERAAEKRRRESEKSGVWDGLNNETDPIDGPQF